MPGYREGENVYGTWFPERRIVYTAWSEDGRDTYDFGIVVMNERAGWLSLMSLAVWDGRQIDRANIGGLFTAMTGQ